MIISLNADMFKEQKINIKSIDDDKIIVSKANLKVGSSGIIIHNYDNNHHTILANVIVLKSDDKSSILEFEDFNSYNQDSIPKTNLKVTKEDKVILNYLYNSAIVIAPNSELLQSVQNKYKDNIMFIHSDQFGAYLAVEHTPKPEIDDFKKFCNDRAIGLIFFVLKENVHIVDAKSFKTIKSYKHNQTITKTAVPFYTRVEDIKESALDFLSSPIKDYMKYYSELLKK
jgi:hypothetical protein